MGSKNDYTQSKICNHHPETCTCRDEDDVVKHEKNKPMSNTKIVIDKDDWDKIASEFNSNDLPIVTEIQIDQSIEDAFVEPLIQKIFDFAEDSSPYLDFIAGFEKGKIIEQLRVKEKYNEGKIKSNVKLISNTPPPPPPPPPSPRVIREGEIIPPRNK